MLGLLVLLIFQFALPEKPTPESAAAGLWLSFVFAERVEDVWREVLIPLFLVKSVDRKYDEKEYAADHQKAERQAKMNDHR